ncbi:MAG: cytochrome c class [Fibrobacteres bacterium]|nr:cytochrome c class [Fibrobacterota bacterium]
MDAKIGLGADAPGTERKRRLETRRGTLRGATGAIWALAAAACMLAAPAKAQTCAEPKAADFKKTILLSSGLDHPVHLAVVPDGRVFIGEMTTGNIQVYKPGATAPVLAGTVATRFENEDGLLGIAAPPDFSQSRFLYVIYSDPDKVNRAHVVSRFTVNGDKLDMASKVEILRFARVPGGIYHAGGGMVFDDKGNLLISTGDDTNPHDGPNWGFAPIYWKEPGKDAQKSASNTNDLRGKIIRIHPESVPVNGKNYSIPAGNFKEAFASFYSAAELAKVRAEIYTMGMRNPYRFTVDNKTGWVIWGEVGPDANDDSVQRGRMGHDELNVATKPGFFGWPYCNGNQFAYNNVDYSGAAGVPGAKFDCANPVNNSPNNTGVNKLPPSQPPVIWYAGNNNTDFKVMGNGGETAMGGPMYRYDRNLNSATKFPPQYDGRLFFWDWSRQVHKLVSFKPDGKLDSIYAFPDATLKSDVSAQYGPEGSLYILQYSESGYGDTKSALIRIDYTGARNEACIPLAIAPFAARRAANERLSVMAGFSAIDLPEGASGFQAFDMHGRKVWTYVRARAEGGSRVELPARIAGGLLRIRFL